MANIGPKVDTIKKQQVFLEVYAQEGIIYKACSAAGIHRQTYYKWKDTDPKFSADLELADQHFNETLEAEMDRRGKLGIDKPIYYKGERVDTIKEYSDVLLIVRAKAKMPDKYKDRTATEFSGKVQVEPIQLQVEFINVKQGTEEG